MNKARLKKIISEMVKEALAVRRQLSDKIRKHGTAMVLINGQWFLADRGSIDPDEPNTLFVVDKDGNDYEVRYSDIESVE